MFDPGKGRPVVFPGPCPFLTCLISARHTHPVCQECGAVRYGNILCPTCRTVPHGVEVDHEERIDSGDILFGLKASSRIAQLLICSRHRSAFNRKPDMFFLFAETVAENMKVFDIEKEILPQLEILPACERVDAAKLLELYLQTGTGSPGVCSVCDKEAEGIADWFYDCEEHGHIEFDHLCFACLSSPEEADA